MVSSKVWWNQILASCQTKEGVLEILNNGRSYQTEVIFKIDSSFAIMIQNVFKQEICVTYFYDQKWYSDKILVVSEEFGDIYVEFMKMGATSFNAWAANKVQCWLFTVIIICIIRALLDLVVVFSAVAKFFSLEWFMYVHTIYAKTVLHSYM